MKMLIMLFLCISVVWAEPKLSEGEIGGAKYKILSAEKPSGKVLLLAHGYRTKGNPLSADFDMEGTMASTLIAEGWTIASTSYRRNGWIIDDALLDLKALQDKVVEFQGEIKTTYILGNSMGAQIAVIAAEGSLEVDGAITTGAAFQNYPKKGMTEKLSYLPKVPVILLINKEINRPMSVKYHKKAGDKNCALWKIERPGHCNVSDLEKLSAINALERWNSGGDVARKKDATLALPKRLSTAIPALVGKVDRVSESWGNIITSFVTSDLTKLGVKLKDKLIIRAGAKSHKVTLVTHYSEAAKGQAVAYIDSEGYLIVMMFGKRFTDILGAKVGDGLVLSKSS